MPTEKSEHRAAVAEDRLLPALIDTGAGEEQGYFVEAPDLRRVGPLTAEHIAALIKYGYLKNDDFVWLEGSPEPIGIASNRERFVRHAPARGYHDAVLALLPAAVVARLPKNAERRRGLVKGTLNALSDFFLSIFFLMAYFLPAQSDASLAAGAGYMAAIEAVAVWGGFFLDAAYGSGRERKTRVAFAAFFFLYYGGVILGVGLLGSAGIWPALYAVYSLLQRLPRLVRRMTAQGRRLALESVIVGFGQFAYSNLMLVVAFVGSVYAALIAGNSPSQELPWLVFLSIYFFGQGLARVFTGLFENRISEYVDYCVAYNMMGAVRKR